MDQRERIQAGAERLGFSFFGITRPAEPAHLAVYRDWLRAGRHGEMAYLAAEPAVEKRAHPERILPGCRSIIVVGLRYANPSSLPESPRSEGPFGRMAAYAWGKDYHDIIVPRLRELAAWLEAELGCSVAHKAYTDTGPILERDLAQQAGLGWIGKNTLLISPDQGSCFLLGELFLDVDLPANTPFEADRCGTCTRCLDACPTGCILPDRTLDARRCISYLTIENRGDIPLELRPLVGNWVFGCDVCQQVCPWNKRFAGGPVDPELAPRPDVPFPGLRRELSLTPEQFNQKFKGSPVKRAKRRGYLRNVAVALGNAGDRAAVPDLARTLRHEPEALVRRHAAWALGQLGGRDARHALETALPAETNALVREEIRRALDQGSQAG